MAAPKAPAFPFYTKEWLSSSAVRCMNGSERGIYLEMLAWQWEDGSVPDDPERFARMAALGAEEVAAAWPAVRGEFEARDGVLVNRRLEMARKELVAYRKERSRSGKKGNESRWGGREAKRQPQVPSVDSSDRSAIAQRSPALALASALRSNPLDLDSRSSGDAARANTEPGQGRVVDESGEERVPSPRPNSLDVLGLGQIFDKLEGKVASDETRQHSEVVRFLNTLFPATRPGQGLSAVVTTWTGRIEEHRIKRAIEEIKAGEYPSGENGTRIGWRDLNTESRKRVVLSVMNGMLT